MITRTDLNDRVREWSLRDDVVEKDYVIGWVLWGIGSDPQLSRRLGVQGRHLPEEVLPGDLPFLRGPGLYRSPRRTY